MAARSAIAIMTFAGITHAHGYHLSDLMRDLTNHKRKHLKK